MAAAVLALLAGMAVPSLGNEQTIAASVYEQVTRALLRAADKETPSRVEMLDAVRPLGFHETKHRSAPSMSPSEEFAPPRARLLPFDLAVELALVSAPPTLIKTLENAQPQGAGPVLFVESGTMTAQRLAQTLIDLGARQLIEVSGNSVTLRVPLVLSSTASLSLDDSAHLQLSREAGAFVIAAGPFRADRATVSGTQRPNSREAGFRPFILAGLGGGVDIVGSRFTNLGFGGGRYVSGLSIGQSDAASGAIVRNNLFQDVTSLTLSNSDRALVDENTFVRSLGTALSVESSDSVTISRNFILGTKGLHGIRVGIDATNALIEGNVISGSARHGIMVDPSARETQIVDNLVLANNGAGVAIMGGACTSLERNELVGNHADGLMSRNSTSVYMNANLVAFNGRAGTSFLSSGTDASLYFIDNTVRGNRVGLRAGSDVRMYLLDNKWTGQTPRLVEGARQGLAISFLTSLREGKQEFLVAGSRVISRSQWNTQKVDTRCAVSRTAELEGA
jgi:hypothetical protein